MQGLSNSGFVFLWNTRENMAMDFLRDDHGSWQCFNALYFIIIKGHINCNNYAACPWINVTVGECEYMCDGYVLQSVSPGINIPV